MDQNRNSILCGWTRLRGRDHEQEGIPEEQWCYEKNDDEYGPGMKANDNFLELNGYRLPTEAEWEFACRAEGRTSGYYGETESLLPRYAWYQVNGENHTHPVASLKPNDFGLFDMHGNVREWCYDTYVNYPTASDDVASDSPSTESVHPTGRRVLRGGAFFNRSSNVRSADRSHLRPGNITDTYGFRPARTYHLFP
jgi:formylglycine-generating enzyme required for sulfatase activity